MNLGSLLRHHIHRRLLVGGRRGLVLQQFQSRFNAEDGELVSVLVRSGEDAAIGATVGRGFSEDDVIDAVETIVDTYLALRTGPAEPFLSAYRRLGDQPFKEALYGTQRNAA